MTDPVHIALIDDDRAILDSLSAYLQRNGTTVSCFESADAFLLSVRKLQYFDCVVADVKMPGMSGLDLVRHLATDQPPVPIVLITGHGDIDMAVSAMKLGAADFLEKPFDEARLVSVIFTLVAVAQKASADAAEIADIKQRYESLTERQQQVMDLAVQGSSNKEIGTRLGISPKTVEIHRAWMMEKMRARNLADLVRIAMLRRPPR
jgi:FixJ family two-component response regulator